MIIVYLLSAWCFTTGIGFLGLALQLHRQNNLIIRLDAAVAALSSCPFEKVEGVRD